MRIPVVVTGQAFSAAAGKDVTISDTIYFNATSVSEGGLYSGNSLVTSFNGLAFDASCKAIWTGTVGTTKGFALPAGSTLSIESLSTIASASVTTGSPVLDALNARAPEQSSPNTRTQVALTFSLTNAKAPGTANLLFKLTAGTRVQQFAIPVSYPACTPAT